VSDAAHIHAPTDPESSSSGTLCEKPQTLQAVGYGLALRRRMWETSPSRLRTSRLSRNRITDRGCYTPPELRRHTEETPMSEHPMIIVHPAAEDLARQLGLAPRLPSLRALAWASSTTRSTTPTRFFTRSKRSSPRITASSGSSATGRRAPAFPPRPRFWPGWPNPATPWYTALPTEGRA
jgi:hypothetical protein